MTLLPSSPAADCPDCPRLAAFRKANSAEWPDWHNGPVASFGPADSRLLVVGLAPGLQGANRTGRPFTGDYAGDLLYATLAKYGFSRGAYQARSDDGLQLLGCRITNAVRCVPPQNKPTRAEAENCRRFLTAEISGMPGLSAILALGRIAHDNVVSALQRPRSAHAFGHGARHELGGGRLLFDSYHCSRYNTNTGRLTEKMFAQVFAGIRRHLDGA